MERCADLLLRHGGPRAGPPDSACDAAVLPELRERLTSIAAEQVGAATVSREGGCRTPRSGPTKLMGQTLRAIRQLEPFGIGNPTPVFLARGVRVLSASRMGTEAQQLQAAHPCRRLPAWDVVAFGQRWRDGVDPHRHDLHARRRSLERTAPAAAETPRLRRHPSGPVGGGGGNRSKSVRPARSPGALIHQGRRHRPAEAGRESEGCSGPDRREGAARPRAPPPGNSSAHVHRMRPAAQRAPSRPWRGRRLPPRRSAAAANPTPRDRRTRSR